MSLAHRRFQDALKVLRSLEEAGSPARLAGGCVRDRLLGIDPADYDIATAAQPEAVLHIFQTEQRTTVPTGIDHGTVTVVMPSGPIEVTTLRKDVATDGRHAEVAFGRSFEEDAQRRDFTINALFEDANQRIYDYVGGRADLDGQVLRFVGAAHGRIREDYLRIMRLFRFWARFGFTPDQGTLAAVHSEREGLRQISQERITSELLKMLAADHLRAPLQALVDTGVWSLILPELASLGERLPTAEQLRDWTSGAPLAQRGLGVLGGLCLLHEQIDEAAGERLGERLRLSKQDVRTLTFFVAGPRLLEATKPLDTAAALDVIDACESAGGVGAFTQVYAPVWLSLMAPDARTELKHVQQEGERHGHRRQATLPLSGHDLTQQLGLAPGPSLGRILKTLKQAYRNGTWQTRAEGLAYAKELVGPEKRF